jgi:hypothetical protein
MPPLGSGFLHHISLTNATSNHRLVWTSKQSVVAEDAKTVSHAVQEKNASQSATQDDIIKDEGSSRDVIISS